MALDAGAVLWKVVRGITPGTRPLRFVSPAKPSGAPFGFSG